MLEFECGLAKLSSGYAICGKLDGLYTVKLHDDGAACIEGSLMEFLAEKAVKADRFIANIASIEDTRGLDNDAKNRTMAQSIRNLVSIVNAKGYQAEHYIFTQIIKGHGAFLMSKPKSGGRKSIIAKLSIENFYADSLKDGQMRALDGVLWHIDNVASYIDRKDRCYGIVCLSVDNTATLTACDI